jgi:hypothetical protein
MAGPGAIEKPTVFVSHAVTDEPIARVIHDEIRRIFVDGVQVFASSVPGAIQPGSEWLKEIRSNLTAATAVVVIVTPTSINRPWVWFEVGASWSRMEEGEGRILPICVPEIDKGALPEPLGRLQALSLGNAAETKELFQSLCDQFGFGKVKGFRYSSVKAKLPRYETLSVSDKDLRSGTIYTGPYEGYSPQELDLVVDDRVVAPEWDRAEDALLIGGANLFNEKLLHFREVDERFQLPRGTAKERLRLVVTKNYPTEVVLETDNTIRFKRGSFEDYQLWRAERGLY